MKYFILLVTIFFTGTVLAQRKPKPKETFYAFDKNWNTVGDVSKGTYFVRITQWGDTLFKWDTYNMFGPLISVEYFKDKEAKTLHGESRYFNAKGKLDSIANFRDGYAHGDFVYLNDTGRTYLTRTFENGKLISTKDNLVKDSVKIDSMKLFTTVEVESEYVGKTNAWRNYLMKNLRYPERAINARIQGTVVVQFIIDKDGKVINPEIYKSVEYSLDQEALRLIQQSADWTPAEQNGKKVKSFKRQPIIFRLS